jgi:hypothetical protein
MSEERDFSKVTRYDWVTRTWFEETYECIGEDTTGNYVLFKDYKDLLDAKTPKRQASFSELKDLIKKEIFEKKDSINYGVAVHRYDEARQLQKALYKIEQLTDGTI